MLCVGYAGFEAFDIILYIARTLTKLNKRVLIIDLSNAETMKRVVYHGMDLDSEKEIVNYRDINYVRTIPSEEDISMFKDGIVFVVFGQRYGELLKLSNSNRLDNLTIVVNTFPSFISDINEELVSLDDNINKRLLIRDVLDIDDMERVENEIKLKFNPKNIDYLYLNIEDYESAVKCQVSQVVRFTNISSRTEKHIIKEIRLLYPDIKERAIRKAMTIAKKGV